MKNKLLFEALFLFSFLLIGAIGQGQAQDVSKVGVAVGDSFNFEISQNDFYSASTNYLNYLLTYYNDTLSSYTVNSNYNLTSIINTLNETIKPNVGDVIGITVVQLPNSNSLSGMLNYTYGSTTKEVLTGFLIGTPVTTTDWSSWIQFLNGIYKSSSTDGYQIITGAYSNAQTFNATISITFTSVPTQLSNLGYQSLSVDLYAYYNATTGVLNSEKLDLKIAGSPSGPTSVQNFAFTRTNKQLSSNTNTSSNGSGPVPGFEAIAVLVALPVVAALYKRRK